MEYMYHSKSLWGHKQRDIAIILAHCYIVVTQAQLELESNRKLLV